MSLRERKEVQKMPRSVAVAQASGLHAGVLAGVGGGASYAGQVSGVQASGLRYIGLLLLFAAIAQAAIFPDQIGEFTRAAPKALALPDQALYNEYGLDATEQAEYTSADKRFTATAWRFRDSTGALAMFELRRPSGANSSKLPELSAHMSDGWLFAFGNYVFQVTGMPPDKIMDQLFGAAPKLERGPLPALAGFLPADGLVPNSERYVVGPVSLQRFEPRISPSLAAFHLGAEAQLGRYRTPKGEMTLTVFNYPTPNLARERQDEFQKIPGALVKRTGPLVAVILQPPDADAAERTLSQVRYIADLTENERVPKDETKSFANAMLNMFALAGLLIGLSVIVGLGFGGFKVFAFKMGWREDPGTLTVLRLVPRSDDQSSPR